MLSVVPSVISPLEPVVVDPVVVDPVVGAPVVDDPGPASLEVGPVVDAVVDPVTEAAVVVVVPDVAPELDEPVMSGPGEKQPTSPPTPTIASLATPRTRGIPEKGVDDGRIAATIPQRPRAT